MVGWIYTDINLSNLRPVHTLSTLCLANFSFFFLSFSFISQLSIYLVEKADFLLICFGVVSSYSLSDRFGIPLISQLVTMAEELTKIMQKFALNNQECNITDLDVGNSSLSRQECLLSLMGKIRGEKIANFTRVKNFVTNVRGYPKDLKVIDWDLTYTNL